MKKIILLFILISSSCFAQSKFKLITTIETDCDFFTTDNQSNIYVVKKDELTKYNKAGKQLYKYSNKKFGDISYVDAANMLKVLVFYKDFSQAVFLDNTLSLNGEPISFDKIGFQQVSLICTSFNNGLWVYNQQNFELLQLNTAYETIHHSENLNNLLNIDLQPTRMMEHDNKLYLNNPSSGILIFDIYGTYYKTVPAKNVKQFQAITDWVYYMQEDKLRSYNIKTTEENEFALPVKDFLGFRLEMETLMIQTATGISIYSAE